MNKRLVWMAEVLALAGIYFLAGKIGLSLAVVNVSATAVWPPTGISLAVLLLAGYRFWPGIFLGAFLLNLLTQGSWATTAGLAAGNTLEAVAGAWLVNRFAGGRKAFERARTVFRFAGVAAVLATTISATFGVTSLALGGFARWENYGPVWLTWWLGNAVSNLSIAPLIIVWWTRGWLRLRAFQAAEACVLLLLLIGLGQLVFWGRGMGESAYPLAYLALPLIVWASFRFDQRGAITASLLMSMIALAGTLQGLGPFAVPDSNASLLLLQAFTGVLSLTGLVLGAALFERAEADRRLQVQDAISRILAEAGSLGEAVERVLRALCETAAWDVGLFWFVHRQENLLRCMKVWHHPEVRFPEFEAASRGRSFAPGIGLPGRVWSRGEPAWIPNVAKDMNFPRMPVAVKDGLRSGFSFPLKMKDEVLAVIECFSRKSRDADEDFLRMMAGIGNQLGQFMERKRAETELRTSEELYRAVTESAADGIITINENSVMLSVNRATELIFGYDSREMVGKSLTMLMPERFRSMHLLGMRRYLETGVRNIGWRAVELPGLHKSGTELSLEISFGRSARDGEHLFTGVVRNISERKRAEEALRASRQQLQLVTDALPVLISYVDSEGRYRFNNQAYEQWFGISRESIFGRHLREVLGEPTYQRIEPHTEAALAGKYARFEAEVAYPSGGTRIIQADYIPHFDEDRRVLGFFALVADITESKRESERIEFLSEATALLNQSLDYRKTLQGLARMVVPRVADWCAIDLLEKDGSLHRLAAAHADPAKVQVAMDLHRRYPGSPEDPIPRVLRTHQTEWAAEVSDELLQSAAKDAEHLAIFRNLGLRSYLILPLVVREKALGAMTLAMADSDRRFGESDLRFAEELARRAGLALDNALLYQEVEERVGRRTADLKEINRELEAFTHTVAHDLRSPLRAISGFSQALSDDYRSVLDQKGDEHLQRIIVAAKRMDDLIGDLLSYSRLSHSELGLARVDLSAVIDRARQAVALEVQIKNAIVAVVGPLPAVWAHSGTVERILVNLISNALKFVSPDVQPRIEISAEHRGKYVRLLIRDNGIGIAPEHLHRVFGMFERLHSPSNYPGTGIGLAIVKKGAERMGGTAGADSEPGKGSAFWIELPAA